MNGSHVHSSPTGEPEADGRTNGNEVMAPEDVAIRVVVQEPGRASSDRMARVRAKLANRAAATARQAGQTVERIDAAILACNALRASLPEDEAETDPELARLRSQLANRAAGLAEAKRLVLQLNEQAGWELIPVAVLGKPGGGKGVLIGSATGFRGIVPSRRGRPVTGVQIRVRHTPGVTSRRAEIALRDGTLRTVKGSAIDPWLTLHNTRDEKNDAYTQVKEAEISVEFPNPVGRIFAFQDTPGAREGSAADAARLREIEASGFPFHLFIERPDDDREDLTPTNHLLIEMAKRVPGFVLVNRKRGNHANAKLRREGLIALGVPPERIITANLANTDEVSRLVLEPILDWFLNCQEENDDAKHH